MIMKKLKLKYEDIISACTDISMQMYSDMWRPDYIVGLKRGGLVPAVIMSHMTGIKMETLSISLHDDEESESNLWMAEHAFGYNDPQKTGITGARWDVGLRKKILVIDDINDTGATFQWLKQDWQSSCLPDEESWKTVWGKNVRFASLTFNEPSSVESQYYSYAINKYEDDCWVVYPWEDNIS